MRVLPEQLRLALQKPDAERVMAGGGPEIDVCIHGTKLAVFCAECAAFFCSMTTADVEALVVDPSAEGSQESKL